MYTRVRIVLGAALLLVLVQQTKAQAKAPTETRNAALRYWLAFADLQDPPADKATTELLEKTAAGEAAWNEAKLGPILDKNEVAIWRMQRATKLPDCDWGLEYDLGPRASIAYLPKARVMARLNTLHGMRLEAKGESQKAVDTWIAGIRFSKHLARGGSLIFVLSASLALVSDIEAIAAEAKKGKLDDAERRQIEVSVKALPETGFDWGEAFWYETNTDAIDRTVAEMARAKNPKAYYEELMGAPAPGDFTVPSPGDIARFHEKASAVEVALRLPPEAARQKLQELQAAINTLHPFFRQLTPSLARINDARANVEKARRNLMQALTSK